MITTESLLQLIRSLTDLERDAFKKSAVKKKGGEQIKYIELFKMISAYNGNNIERLTQKIEATIGSHYFEVKNYLFYKILDFIASEQKLELIEEKLEFELKKAEILFKRGLFEESKQLIKELKEKTVEHDLYLLICKILELEYRLANRLNPEDFTKNFTVFIDQTVEATNQHKTLLEYRKNFANLVSLSNTDGIVRDHKLPEETEKIIKSKLFTDISYASTFKTRSLFYSARMCYYNMTSDFIKEYELGEELIKLLKQNADKVKRSNSYMLTLGMHLITSLHLKKLSHFQEQFNTFQAFTFKQNFNVIIHQILLYTIKLYVLILKGNIQASINLIKEAEKELDPSWESQPYQTYALRLKFLFAYAYFIYADFKQTNIYLNYIIDQPKGDVKSEIKSFSRIFKLIVDYEMQKHVSLEYAIRNAKYYFQKHDKQFFLEFSFLKFIKNLIGLTEKEQLKQLISDYKMELIAKVGEFNLMHITNGFDLISWLDSKQQGENYASAILNKAKNTYSSLLEIEV